MATPVTSGTSAFAFLNGTGSPSTASASTRQSSSGSGFSDILSGQMRAKPASPAASRSSTESANAARTPERTTQQPPAAERTQEPEHARESAASAERAHPDKTSTAAPAATDAQHGERVTKLDKHAARAASEPAPTSDMVSESTAAAATAAALAAANTEAAAAEAAPDAASAASNLAGVPAVIAALLPALAAKQSSATGTALVSGDAAKNAIGVDAGAEMGLTGDTRGNSLQNPFVANTKAVLNPELSTLPSQPPAAQADQQESSASLADKLALEAKTAPASGKAKDSASTGLTTLQTLAAAQLHAKAEVPASLAERTVMTPAPADDAQLGVQGSVMHTLRQPGQLPATPPQLPVATPAGQNGWANEVGNRVMWMVGRAESRAELVLTPPNLGKVEVSINLNGDQTTAQFVAATQSARDALEQAMPRLRELLAQSGISLGHTGVSTSGEQQNASDERTRGGNGGNGATGGSQAGEAGSAAPWVRQTEGLVDTFA